MLAIVVNRILERLHHVLGGAWGSKLGLELVLINIKLLLVDVGHAVSLHTEVSHVLREVLWRFS